MMLSDIRSYLVIIDPLLESKVIDIVERANLEIAGRYLSLIEFEREAEEDSLLITTSDLLTPAKAEQLSRVALRVISIGNGELRDMSSVVGVSDSKLESIPELIMKAPSVHEEVDPVEARGLVVGVLPRVGASTIEGLIDGAMVGLLPSFRTSNNSDLVLCSEFDDSSLVQLFTQLIREREKKRNPAVVINKVPRNRSSDRRIEVVTRELEELGAAMVCRIYFDEELQMNGKPNKRTLQDLKPLFDWIAKPN